MKKLFILFSAVFALLMVSCSQDSFDLFKNNWHGNTRADGNCELNWPALDTAYFVTNKDVNAYVHFKKLLAESEKCDFSVKEVVPIGLNEKDTLAYLLNFNNGWEIIAAINVLLLSSPLEKTKTLNSAKFRRTSWHGLNL